MLEPTNKQLKEKIERKEKKLFDIAPPSKCLHSLIICCLNFKIVYGRDRCRHCILEALFRTKMMIERGWSERERERVIEKGEMLAVRRD